MVDLSGWLLTSWSRLPFGRRLGIWLERRWFSDAIPKFYYSIGDAVSARTLFLAPPEVDIRSWEEFYQKEPEGSLIHIAPVPFLLDLFNNSHKSQPRDIYLREIELDCFGYLPLPPESWRANFVQSVMAGGRGSEGSFYVRSNRKSRTKLMLFRMAARDTGAPVGHLRIPPGQFGQVAIWYLPDLEGVHSLRVRVKVTDEGRDRWIRSPEIHRVASAKSFEAYLPGTQSHDFLVIDRIDATAFHALVRQNEQVFGPWDDSLPLDNNRTVTVTGTVAPEAW